jgi:hypothetical protein
MKSLPTIDYHVMARHNREKLLSVLTELAPSLYRIQMALDTYKVNPELIPPIIRTIGNLNIGTGYGEVTILIKSRVATQIKGSESNIVGLPVDNGGEMGVE